MSEGPDNKRKWIMKGGFAASVEFDERTKTFDFLLENGQHELVCFPEATPEEIEKAIDDIRLCVPIVKNPISD